MTSSGSESSNREPDSHEQVGVSPTPSTDTQELSISKEQVIDCRQVSTGIDLAVLGVQDLLQLDAEIIAQLRRRNLARTDNKPLGDIAEAVVPAARGGTPSEQQHQVRGGCHTDTTPYPAAGTSGTPACS